MPTFVPLSETGGLPPINSSAEAATWDLKRRFPLSKHFEAAKDVAAFANHLGGTLLIGAEEVHGRIGQYVPLPEPDANATESFVAAAVRDRCRPVPVFDSVRFAHGGGYVVAINVWPALGAPVAVRVAADRNAEGWGGDAWVFPLRIGAHTHFVQPESLAMYMSPKIRRAVLMLNKIQVGTPVAITMPTPGGGVGNYTHLFVAVDEENNLVTFREQMDMNRLRQFPLDRVRTVYRDQHGWHVLFSSLSF